MSYGVVSTGFAIKRLATIKSDLEAALKSAFGDEIRVDTKSVWGKIIGAFAQPASDLWELGQAVYSAFYPSTAEGTALDNVCDLVGVTRNAATKSSVSMVLEGAIGVVITSGSKVATVATGDQFQNTANLTLAASVAVRAYTTLVGSVVTDKVYKITINTTTFSYTAVGGDDAAAVGVALQNAINAGAEPVTATHTANGAITTDGDDDSAGLPTPFSVSVNANVSIAKVGNLQTWESVNTGEIEGFANDITSIVTPISNWTAAWNPLDATKGQAEETDAALRLRRAQSLSTPGAGTVEAIRAQLLALTNVTAALVLENTGDTVDSNGLPAKSIECIVLGGTEASIVAKIWERKGGGIYSHGDTLVNVTDSQGFSQPIRYSRPTQKPMWIKLTYAVDSEASPGFPSNGTDLIKAAALAKGNLHSIGNDVLPDQFMGPVISGLTDSAGAAVSGCTGIRTLKVEVALDAGGSPGAYQETPYTIGATEIAKFDSARITVTT